MTSPYLTAREAAEYLRRTPTCLRQWRVKGIGPRYSRPDGTQVLYSREDLDAWVQGGARSSTTNAPEDEAATAAH